MQLLFDKFNQDTALFSIRILLRNQPKMKLSKMLHSISNTMRNCHGWIISWMWNALYTILQSQKEKENDFRKGEPREYRRLIKESELQFGNISIITHNLAIIFYWIIIANWVRSKTNTRSTKRKLYLARVKGFWYLNISTLKNIQNFEHS